MIIIFYFYFFYPHPRTFFSLLFREREREEKHQYESESWLDCPPYAGASEGNHQAGPGVTCARKGNWTSNLGKRPDQELDPQPFSYGMMIQPTEPHRPGQKWSLYFKNQVLILLFLLLEIYHIIQLKIKDFRVRNYISCLENCDSIVSFVLGII